LGETTDHEKLEAVDGVDGPEALPEPGGADVAAPEPEPSASPPSIGDEVGQYVTGIDALLNSLGSVMLSLQSDERESAERFSDLAVRYGETIEDADKGRMVRFHAPYDVTARRLNKRIGQAETAVELVPRLFVLALVSQFDAFLGRLLRVAFLLKPDMIAASDRSLTLAQLLEAGTVEAATELILDKEIETVLRKSRTEQFDWMETKFGVKLRKDLPSWGTLIEVTERRNLFAHTNGVVSDQYLSVCRSHDAKIDDDCIKGHTLEVSPDYFRTAHACHFEIGVKLSQVLWRKLFPDAIEEAESNLIDLTLELIVAKRLDIACELLDFAFAKPMKHSCAETRLILTLNRAQAYKWSGNQERCRQIVEDEDWSACEPKYRLAVAVLLDDFSEAATLLRVIGDKGSIGKDCYQDWPIFKEFRKTDDFLEAYEAVFGESFVHIELSLKEDEEQRRRESLVKLREFLDKEASGEEDDESSVPDAVAESI